MGVSQVLGWCHGLQGTGLAGGDGRVPAADIWQVRKRGDRLLWLLAGAPGLGSGVADSQPAALAPLGPDLLNLIVLKK